MKKLLSLVSVFSLIIMMFVTITHAWAPTDFEDVKCLDLRELGKTKDLIRLGQDGERVCGCKKCTVDAVLYSRFEDYIDMLEMEFNKLREAKISPLSGFLAIFGSPTKAELEFEHKAKLNNLKFILEDISKEVEDKSFVNTNFFLVSTNYDPNGPADVIAQVATKKGIPTYNYSEKYFNDIKEKKIVPFLNKVKAVVGSQNKNIGE